MRGFTVRGSWRPNITAILWPKVMAVSIVSFSSPELLNRRPRAHSAWWWLSLLPSYQQLLWTPTHQGFLRAPSTECGFPYHNSSISVSNSTATQLVRRTQLSYIIVRRPLDFWNRMFNCHQAEITVMQFRGHSVVAQWDLHLVPYYQP